MSRRTTAATAGAHTSRAAAPLPERKTQIVAAGALVVGSVFLALTLNVPRGRALFFVTGFLLAAVWAVGFVLARSPRPGRRWAWGDVLAGALAGIAAYLAFLFGRWLVLEIGILGGPLADLLGKADAASRAPVLALAWVSAVTEELFFRGTLVDAVRRRWAAVAGVLPYVVTTAFSANPALIIAALVMGAAFTWLRLWRHSLVAPILCHLVWSSLMITAFPR